MTEAVMTKGALGDQGRSHPAHHAVSFTVRCGPGPNHGGSSMDWSQASLCPAPRSDNQPPPAPPPLRLARKVAYNLAMTIIPLAEAKDGLSALVAEISSTHEHYTITRNGRPVVAMLPVEDLEALEETIFWLE